jgi:hypothetical protein
MFGHAAERQRRWPWVTLSVLFALAFAWSFAVTAERVGDVWGILRLGSAVGLGLSLLRLVLMFISSRRLRRRQDGERRTEGTEGAEIEAEGQPSEQELPTEERGPTYEEIFGLQLDLGEGSLPLPPDEQEWQGEGVWMVAEGQPSKEEMPTEERGPTSEEDLQPSHADPDGAIDQVEAIDAHVDSQEHLRQLREQFKARAEAAALRVKQREAELQQAASASDAAR